MTPPEPTRTGERRPGSAGEPRRRRTLADFVALPRTAPRPVTATRHEQHLAHRSEARGQDGQIEALLGLKGVLVGGRHRIESLYAVGGEGAVYLTRDLRAPPEDPSHGVRVAKIALLPLHRPFSLGSRTIRAQRDALRVEATYLQRSASVSMPHFEGFFEFPNPLLDPARGDAFAEPEPVLVMEKLKGCDLDRWLARTHRSGIPQAQMKRTLDRISVVLLQGLVDLYDRGFLYADLRPANLRILGRPDRFVRLLDAGSLVAANDRSGRFPHVPAYLPPALFRDRTEGKPIVPTPETQAIMAGRTLYEVATGLVPHPGEEVEFAALRLGNVSPPVVEVIEGLCTGGFAHVRQALKFLEKRAQRRVSGGNDPVRVVRQATDAAPSPESAAPSPGGVAANSGPAAPPFAPPVPMEFVPPSPGPAPVRAASPTPRQVPAQRVPPRRDPMPTPREVASHLEFTEDRVKTPKLPPEPPRVPTVRPGLNGRAPWWRRWFGR